MQANTLRSRHDIELYNQLLAHNDVKQLNSQIERREAEGPLGTRRHLLSTSVRLSPSMAPGIHKTANECIERLNIDIPVELYVYANSRFNAACVKPEDGRLFIMFSSSLIEGFEDSEFRFVMGHELGHFLFDHHAIPIGRMMSGPKKPDPKLALKLSAWSRYAEISADRAGAHCAQDQEGVARALFKLASGLTGSMVKFDMSEFMAQVDDLQVNNEEPGRGSASSDWFMTHPFSPLRVKALQLFHNSKLAKEKGSEIETLELGVQKLMSLMEPSYLESTSDASEAMRRLLLAGSLLIANANGEASESEIEIFEKFFGQHSHHENLNLEKLNSELDSRIASVKQQTSIGQHMQLLHDLALIARADGSMHPKELTVLERIASQLGISKNTLAILNNELNELD
jgi:uncharacterized tellurite resistance protein B-like protein